MAKPAYNHLKKHFIQGSPCSGIVFVSDRKQARLTALDFVTFTAADDNPEQFRPEELDRQEFAKVTETSLASSLEYGIGILHDGLTNQEVTLVKRLFTEG